MNSRGGLVLGCQLHLDTMVLDNNDALQREGCNVTYKKVLGFQPLQINWFFSGTE